MSLTLHTQPIGVCYSRSPIMYHYSGCELDYFFNFYFYITTGSTNDFQNIHISINRQVNLQSGLTFDVSSVLSDYLENNLDYTNENIIYFKSVLYEYGTGNTFSQTIESDVALATLGYVFTQPNTLIKTTAVKQVDFSTNDLDAFDYRGGSGSYEISDVAYASRELALMGTFVSGTTGRTYAYGGFVVLRDKNDIFNRAIKMLTLAVTFDYPTYAQCESDGGEALIDNFTGGLNEYPDYEASIVAYTNRNAALYGEFSDVFAGYRIYTGLTDNTYWVAGRDKNDTDNIAVNSFIVYCPTTTTTTTTDPYNYYRADIYNCDCEILILDRQIKCLTGLTIGKFYTYFIGESVMEIISTGGTGADATLIYSTPYNSCAETGIVCPTTTTTTTAFSATITLSGRCSSNILYLDGYFNVPYTVDALTSYLLATTSGVSLSHYDTIGYQLNTSIYNGLELPWNTAQQGPYYAVLYVTYNGTTYYSNEIYQSCSVPTTTTTTLAPTTTTTTTTGATTTTTTTLAFDFTTGSECIDFPGCGFIGIGIYPTGGVSPYYYANQTFTGQTDALNYSGTWSGPVTFGLTVSVFVNGTYWVVAKDSAGTKVAKQHTLYCCP